MSMLLLRLETSTTIAGPKKASSDSSWDPDQSSRTCSGASAWVPTCGLEVNDDTFTLAPAAIDDAQAQVNGVSPGHSGVSGFSVTLMSRSRGSLPFMRARSELFLPQKLLRRLDHFLNGDAEMLIDGGRRSRSAEAVDAENYPVVTDPAVPRHRVRGFHGNAFHALRQHAVAVGLVLGGEQLMTRHAHRARPNAVGLELLLGVENERNLGAAGHENDLGCAARSIGEHISAFVESSRRGVLRAIDERELLPRQHESDGTFELECDAPGLGGLRCISGPDQRDLGDGAQRAQLLDRLMCWSILAEADGIVGVDVDDVPIHDARQAHRRPHVIGKDQKCRAVRNDPAEKRHAVHDRAHRVFTDAEMEIATGVALGGEAGLALDDGVGGAG